MSMAATLSEALETYRHNLQVVIEGGMSCAYFEALDVTGLYMVNSAYVITCEVGKEGAQILRNLHLMGRIAPNTCNSDKSYPRIFSRMNDFTASMFTQAGSTEVKINIAGPSCFLAIQGAAYLLGFLVNSLPQRPDSILLPAYSYESNNSVVVLNLAHRYLAVEQVISDQIAGREAGDEEADTFVRYEPEKFPGATFTPPPQVGDCKALVVFSTGKITFLGALGLARLHQTLPRRVKTLKRFLGEGSRGSGHVRQLQRVDAKERWNSINRRPPSLIGSSTKKPPSPPQ
jgi:hypothetical protein